MNTTRCGPPKNKRNKQKRIRGGGNGGAQTWDPSRSHWGTSGGLSPTHCGSPKVPGRDTQCAFCWPPWVPGKCVWCPLQPLTFAACPIGASRKPGWHPGRHRWVPCKFSQRWPFGHSWGSQAHSSTSERQRSSMSTHPNLPQHPTPAQEGPPRPRAAANELLHSLSPSSTYPYPTQYKAQGETPMEQGAWGCSPTQNMPSGSNSKPSGQLGSFSSVRQVREIERNIKTLSPKQQDTPQTRAYMIILSNV